MNETGVYELMGISNFFWFHAIVEDVKDPLTTGRVRVRCFGYHDSDKMKIPTEHLPWAFVMSPTTSASVSGIGFTPHALVQGSQVIGFFRDGANAQHPIVMGSIPGHIKELPDFETGFSDPDGKYPLEDRIGTPDVNQLAGSSHADAPYRINREESLRKDIETARGDLWSEPSSQASPVYPNNKVMETTSGHIVELDDTENVERIAISHKSGTYIEIGPDGSVSRKSVSGETHIIDADSNIFVGGDSRIHIQNNLDSVVGESVDILVKNGNVKITVSNGSVDLNVDGDCTATIGGSMTANIENDINIDAKGSGRIRSSERMTIESGKDVIIRGSSIRLN